MCLDIGHVVLSRVPNVCNTNMFHLKKKVATLHVQHVSRCDEVSMLHCKVSFKFLKFTLSRVVLVYALYLDLFYILFSSSVLGIGKTGNTSLIIPWVHSSIFLVMGKWFDSNVCWISTFHIILFFFQKMCAFFLCNFKYKIQPQLQLDSYTLCLSS